MLKKILVIGEVSHRLVWWSKGKIKAMYWT